MPIEIQTNQSARIRQLKRDQPYLEPADLVEMTGLDLKLVKAALTRPEKTFRLKSRLEIQR
jgi:hypothetical protein